MNAWYNFACLKTISVSSLGLKDLAVAILTDDTGIVAQVHIMKKRNAVISSSLYATCCRCGLPFDVFQTCLNAG